MTLSSKVLGNTARRIGVIASRGSGKTLTALAFLLDYLDSKVGKTVAYVGK